jgi:hypothetical protein
VQIEQDIALCAARFPDLVCRPIAAQLIGHDAIALFELQPTQDGIRVAFEKHYRLVSPAAISSEDLSNYQRPD